VYVIGNSHAVLQRFKNDDYRVRAYCRDDIICDQPDIPVHELTSHELSSGTCGIRRYVRSESYHDILDDMSDLKVPMTS